MRIQPQVKDTDEGRASPLVLLALPAGSIVRLDRDEQLTGTTAPIGCLASQ